MSRTIMGIEIEKREEEAMQVQNLLTKHGAIIKTRLGLHSTAGSEETHGLILLDLIPNEDEIGALKKELEGYKGVAVQLMTF